MTGVQTCALPIYEMNLDLAEMYGTPGYEQEKQAEEENIEKVAQAELFAKLAADNGIDLNQFTDEQVNDLWVETFGEKLGAACDSDGDGDVGSPETPKEEAAEAAAEKKKKVKKAADEFAGIQDFKEKFAEADYMGRVMAHSYVNELASFGSTQEKEAGVGEAISRASKAVWHASGRAAAAASRIGEKPLVNEAQLSEHDLLARAADRADRHLPAGSTGPRSKLREFAQQHGHHVAGGALAAGGVSAGAAASAPWRKRRAAVRAETNQYARGMIQFQNAHPGMSEDALAREYNQAHKKHASDEGSALDELATELAFQKAAEAGYDQDEAVERLNAVYTLGLGDSTKIAAAEDVDGAVDIRSLEVLEAAGYPVTWE